MFVIAVNGQIWRYNAETEQFFTWEQDGAADQVYRTYADWQRIFPVFRRSYTNGKEISWPMNGAHIEGWRLVG